jgi:cytochrome c-type biogenesis protein CcmE
MPDGDAPAPRSLDVTTEPAVRAPEPPRGTSPVILGIALLGLSGGVAWLLLGGGDPFVYSETVTAVSGDPSEFAGRELRIEGALTEGSIRFRDDPCEWRFSIEEGEHVVPVVFSQCVVPDTFRDHMNITVVVQGELGSDGTFVASQVIPRCPSRYEMDERAGRGESMPHASPIRETPPPPES